MRFLHLGLEDAVPDAKTVWAFKEKLRQQRLVESLFDEFGAYLNGVIRRSRVKSWMRR